MRILFLAVYAVLFSVQIYFKYSHDQPSNTGIDLDATAIRFQHAVRSLEKCIAKLNKVDSLSIKVSKRYLHKNTFEMDFHTPSLCTTFPPIQKLVAHKTLTLHEFIIADTFLRGPPAQA